MKKFYCHSGLFQSLSISADQIAISEGEDSFTIESKDIPLIIELAESFDAREYLKKIPLAGLTKLIQIVKSDIPYQGTTFSNKPIEIK
jgi:hypothetical protein